MTRDNKRQSLAEALRALRDVHADDELVAHALDAAADQIDPDNAPAPDPEFDAIAYEPRCARWLHCLASVGGEEDVAASDEPERRVFIDMTLCLYGGQGDTLIDQINAGRAFDREAYSVRLTLDASLQAQWDEPGDGRTFRRDGPPLAPLLKKALEEATSFEPDDDGQTLYEINPEATR